MTTSQSAFRLYTFGDFEFSDERLELRRNKSAVPLQQQPAKVLAALLARPGELVTREELRRLVWGEGVHLEFADALNHSIKYLRDALGDDAARPKYVETVPRRGYRFIAPVSELPIQPRYGMRITRHRRWSAAAAVVLVVSATAIALAGRPRRLPQVSSVTQLTRFGLANGLATDGERLFVEEEVGGQYRIVEFPLAAATEPVPVPTSFSNVQLLDISPDHRELLIAAFENWKEPRTVWRLPIAGGSPRPVGSIVSNSARWSTNGGRIAFCGKAANERYALYSVDLNGGDLRREAEIPVVNTCAVDSWSPDGRSIRFSQTNTATGANTLWEVRVGEPHLTQILSAPHDAYDVWGEGQCCGRWTPDSRFFLYEDSHQGRVAWWAEAEPRLWSSAPKEIYAFGLEVRGIPVFSNGHRGFFIGRKESRELFRFDAAVRQFVPMLSGTQAMFLEWSPDRQFVAYSHFPEVSLWKSKPDGGGRMQLTFPPVSAFHAVWAPDGKRFAFHTLPPGRLGKIALMPADGGPPHILLPNEPSSEDAQNWAPDGKRLMFQRDWPNDPTKVPSIWILDLDSGKLSKLPDSDGLGPPAWSPDGRYVVAQSSGFDKLMLFDFQTGRWRPLAALGVYIDFPHWSPDSKYVFYQDTRVNDEQPIYRIAIPGGTPEIVATRKQFLSGDVPQFRLISLTPKSEPVVTVIRRDSDVYSFELTSP